MLQSQDSDYEIKIGIINDKINLVDWSAMLDFEDLHDKFESAKQMDFDAKCRVLSILEKAKQEIVNNLHA